MMYTTIASFISGLHVEDVTEYQMKVGHEIKKWIKFQCCESNFLMIVLAYNTDEMNTWNAYLFLKKIQKRQINFT